mgnify:CR=1 FL=1
MKAFWVCLLGVLVIPVFAEYEFGCICSTNAAHATGPSNSHKLAYRSELINPDRDTVTLIFQSAESIYIATSGNGSSPWSRPQALYPGQNPGITWGRSGHRHLVWEMVDTASGVRNIFYRNLEYRMMPINVSQSTVACSHPDVYGDSFRMAHIVWQEGGEIWYRRATESGVIGERFCVSGYAGVACDWPAIEEFNDGISVVWQMFDSQTGVYRIMQRRQVGGMWQPEQVLMESTDPLRHPSVDFSTGGESFSAGWEVSVGTNFEVHFHGGNGGGYPTPGSSTAPVLTTMGTVWSYLFWEEDSLGTKDIFTHFYYFMTGWSRSSIRNIFSIAEPVFSPNCLGALLVWTQGDAPPYKVMWGFFDYPIAAEEQTTTNAKPAPPIPTVVRNVIFLQAAVNSGWVQGGLFDRTGRKVMDLKAGANDVAHLTPGVYFVHQAQRQELRKVIITN